MSPFRIPLSSVTLDDASLAHARDAIDARWLSGTGPHVARFEASLARQVGRRHAVAVTNGTHALELALRTWGIGPGDEVIVPALTFVAPAAAVHAVGATAVFADVDPATWTIDPHDVAHRITARTRAAIAVDVLGHPFDHDALRAAVRRTGIRLLEDAAEAHGARSRGNPAGSLGDAAIFSFHANKTITTGEGGAVVTDDDAVAAGLRLRASHGMTVERPYWHEVTGSNYRLSNVAAAIGLGQLAQWDALVAARNAVAAAYDRALADVFATTPLRRRPIAAWADEACWLYTVAHPRRDHLVAALRAAGIDARAIWTALPDLPPYRGGVRGEYAVARRLAREAFWLPTWTGMPPDVVAEVTGVLRHAVHAS